MSIVTPPKAQIPIGYFVMRDRDGAEQRFEVKQHPEFVRFFFDLMRRIGGTDATDNSALQAALDQAELDIDVLALDTEALQIVPDVFPPIFPPENVDGRLSAMEAELAALRTQVEGLLQGTTP